MPGPAPEDRVPGDARSLLLRLCRPAAGSRERCPTVRRVRRVPRATAGGKAGARAPALLLSHVGLSQGLAPSLPNHLGSGDNEP